MPISKYQIVFILIKMASYGKSGTKSNPSMTVYMVKNQTWEVYIIQAKSGKLYTGITNNLNRRFADHLMNRKGARFFRFSNPEKIVFRESCLNRSEATQKEIKIKKMSRTQKLELIQSFTHS